MNSPLRSFENELLKRVQAKNSLPSFIDYLCFGYKFAAHHKLLMQELEAVERGDVPRLMVLMPPGSAKSTYASVLFPPWFMGRNPAMSVLGVSNTTDLAERFSRRVRNIVSMREFANVFEANGLSEDSAAAGSWETIKGGEFFAAGMGSAIAGRRADLGLIDDPIKTRQEADSDRVRQTQWDWYINDFLTRLKPGARQILIQCLTGDTPILMADGTEKPLRNIRVNDAIATFKNGRLSVSRVLNWASQGKDQIFALRMKSGRVVRANERHPFLADKEGEWRWIKLKNLRVGDRVLGAVGGNGAASNAPSRIAKEMQKPRVFAIRIMPRIDGLAAIVRRQLTRNPGGQLICATDTGLMQFNTKPCWQNRMASARSASSSQAKTCAPTGAASFAWTTIMSLAKRGVCFAMTAILQLGMRRTRKFFSKPLDTYAIAHDEIVEISCAGREEVFDIQVADTENFIANGLVSHNTRWHEDDLGGRILEREAGKWRVVKLPMLAVANDPLGRLAGERLWPEWFTDEMVETARLDTRAWNALYQQEPVPDEGDYFKKENFGEYDSYPSGLHVYGASDFAVTEGDGDFTEHGIFGVDHSGNPYVLDWWRGQKSADVWIEAQCDLIRQWKPLVWFGEAGPIRRAIEPFLSKRMSDRSAYCRLEWLPSISDKEIRARSIQALASVKTISLPKVAPWKADVMKQLLQFPSGKYDDAVDVFSLFGRGLEHVVPARKPRVVVDNEPQHWMG